MSIFLKPTENTQLPIKTEFILSIINKDGAKSVSEKFDWTFEDHDSVGEHKLVSHEDLQNNDLNLLPDDVLTIHCAIAPSPFFRRTKQWSPAEPTDLSSLKKQGVTWRRTFPSSSV